jgi:hypothetical protein
VNYYIASLKHTNKHHEHITFWGINYRGYTPVVGTFIGEYGQAEAETMNDGIDFIAVPVEYVKEILSPEPYYKPSGRFYDQRGPVVENTRLNWNALIAASIKTGRREKPKPEVFRGKRRAVFTELASACDNPQ